MPLEREEGQDWTTSKSWETFGRIRPRGFVGKVDRKEVVTACLRTIVAKT